MVSPRPCTPGPVIGCKDGAPAAADAGGGSESPNLTDHADHILCEFYYRASNEVTSDTEEAVLEFQEEMLEVGPDEDKNVDLGNMTLSVFYDDDQFEGSTVQVRVDAGETRLFSTLYQLRDGKLPTNQFVGDHGFTGVDVLDRP